MDKNTIHSDPQIMGGVPVFTGTRVPVSYLFDYLANGESIEVFLDQYPSVRRDSVMGALEIAQQLIGDHAHIA